MRKNQLVALLIFSLIFQNACKDDELCFSSNKNDLIITVQNQNTTLPAKVSMFFKVDDEDGLPIAGLKSSDFDIYEQGVNDDCERIISSTEASARISPNSQVFLYSTILVLDLSGSVIENSLTELQEASKSFIDKVMPLTEDEAYKMGIWWFDGEDELHTLLAPTSNKEDLKVAIDGITPTISNDPSTDLYGATIKSITEAEDILNINTNIISAASVVIFTDGTDQAARYLKDNAFSAVDNASNQITIYTIGLGDEIDEDVLDRIGKDGSIFAKNKDELEDKFNETAQLVFDEANSYYLFEYCSPKRSGSDNKLRLKATRNKQSGSVLTSFDATGFTSGCN